MVRAILTNPLDQDPVLKDLLRKLDLIETRRGFAKWKKHFLQQFESHLEGVSITKAGQKYHAFARRLDRLVLLLKALERLISAGDLSTTKVTVKSRQSLGELQKQLTGMIQHTQALIPGTLEQENAAGYTKFDMGAVLVRDGFVEYDRLCLCRDVLHHMTDALLREVADRQLLEEMERYEQHLEAFCGIMGNDLGLHGAMLKCRDILRSDDEEFYQYENENGVVVTISSSKHSFPSEYDEEDEDEEDDFDDDEEDDEEDDEHDGYEDYQQQQPLVEHYQDNSSSSNVVSLCGMVIPLRLTKFKNKGGSNTSFYDDLSDNVSELSDDSGGSWYWSLTVPAPPKQRTDNKLNNNTTNSSAIPPPPLTQQQESPSSTKREGMHRLQGPKDLPGPPPPDLQDNQEDEDEDDQDEEEEGEELILRDTSTTTSTLTYTNATNLTGSIMSNEDPDDEENDDHVLHQYDQEKRETETAPSTPKKDEEADKKKKKKRDSPKTPQRTASDLTAIPRRSPSKYYQRTIIPAPPAKFPEFPARQPPQPVPDAAPTQQLKWTLNDYYHGGHRATPDWKIAKEERKQLDSKNSSPKKKSNDSETASPSRASAAAVPMSPAPASPTRRARRQEEDTTEGLDSPRQKAEHYQYSKDDDLSTVASKTGSKKIVLKARLRKKNNDPSSPGSVGSANNVIMNGSGHSGSLDDISDDRVIIRRRNKSNNDSGDETDASSKGSISSTRSHGAGSDDLDVIQHRRTPKTSSNMASPTSPNGKMRAARRASKSSEMRRMARRALRRRGEDDDGSSSGGSYRRRRSSSRRRRRRRASSAGTGGSIASVNSTSSSTNSKKVDPLHNLLFKNSGHQNRNGNPKPSLMYSSSDSGDLDDDLGARRTRRNSVSADFSVDHSPEHRNRELQRQQHHDRSHDQHSEQSSATTQKSKTSSSQTSSASSKDEEDDDDMNAGGDESERRKLCYSWYGRLGHPSRDAFKRRVRASEGDMGGLREQDVDLLPWIHSGARINVGAMTKLFTQ